MTRVAHLYTRLTDRSARAWITLSDWGHQAAQAAALRPELVVAALRVVAALPVGWGAVFTLAEHHLGLAVAEHTLYEGAYTQYLQSADALSASRARVDPAHYRTDPVHLQLAATDRRHTANFERYLRDPQGPTRWAPLALSLEVHGGATPSSRAARALHEVVHASRIPLGDLWSFGSVHPALERGSQPLQQLALTMQTENPRHPPYTVGQVLARAVVTLEEVGRIQPPPWGAQAARDLPLPFRPARPGLAIYVPPADLDVGWLRLSGVPPRLVQFYRRPGAAPLGVDAPTDLPLD